MEKKILEIFGVCIFEYDESVSFDGDTQFHVTKWLIEDMGKFTNKYAVLRYDDNLKVYEDTGELLFDESILHSNCFRDKLREIICK